MTCVDKVEGGYERERAVHSYGLEESDSQDKPDRYSDEYAYPYAG
jgi:hypothetical protein